MESNQRSLLRTPAIVGIIVVLLLAAGFFWLGGRKSGVAYKECLVERAQLPNETAGLQVFRWNYSIPPNHVAIFRYIVATNSPPQMIEGLTVWFAAGTNQPAKGFMQWSQQDGHTLSPELDQQERWDMVFRTAEGSGISDSLWMDKVWRNSMLGLGDTFRIEPGKTEDIWVNYLQLDGRNNFVNYSDRYGSNYVLMQVSLEALPPGMNAGDRGFGGTGTNWAALLPRFMRPDDSQESISTPSRQPAVPDLSFGPVTENSLLFNTNGTTDGFCLESNQLVMFPRSGKPPECIAFVDDPDDTAIFIRTIWDVFFMPVKNQEWDDLPVARKMDLVAANTNLTWTWVTMVKKTDLPTTYLFRTSSGLVGVFQLSNLTNGENGVGIRYKFLTEASTNALFPALDYTQTSRPNGVKPIPREAAKLFFQSRELIISMASHRGSEARASMVEMEKLVMRRNDIEHELAGLTKGTPFESARWDDAQFSRRFEQIDPNHDQTNWQQAEAEMKVARFNEERLMADAGAADCIQPQAGELKFGPWIETTLLHPSVGSNCCINIDSGDVLTPPTEILTAMTVTNRPGKDFFEAMPESFFWGRYRAASKDTNALAQWIEDSSVDAVPLGAYGLVVFCPVCSTILMEETGDAANWEGRITPAWLLWRLYFTGKMNTEPKAPNAYELLTFPTGASASTNSLCLFRTRSGKLGVLQITGFTDNPPGVKIRYKLVRNSNTTATSVRLPPAAAPELSFGPVMERTIYDYKSGKDWLLNLKTGETFPPPAGLNWDKNFSAIWEWVHAHGAHVAGLSEFSQHWHEGDPYPVILTLNDGYGPPTAAKRGLFGFEMKAAIVPATGVTFETVTPPQLDGALQNQPASPRRDSSGGPWLPQFASMPWHDAKWQGTDDYLYAFQTDDGQSGVLQITGFTENPRGVKIRYKLVQQ